MSGRRRRRKVADAPARGAEERQVRLRAGGRHRGGVQAQEAPAPGGGEEDRSRPTGRTGARSGSTSRSATSRPRLSTERLRIAEQVEGRGAGAEHVRRSRALLHPDSEEEGREGDELRAERDGLQAPRGEQQAEQGRRTGRVLQRRRGGAPGHPGPEVRQDPDAAPFRGRQVPPDGSGAREEGGDDPLLPPRPGRDEAEAAANHEQELDRPAARATEILGEEGRERSGPGGSRWPPTSRLSLERKALAVPVEVGDDPEASRGPRPTSKRAMFLRPWNRPPGQRSR